MREHYRIISVTTFARQFLVRSTTMRINKVTMRFGASVRKDNDDFWRRDQKFATVKLDQYSRVIYYKSDTLSLKGHHPTGNFHEKKWIAKPKVTYTRTNHVKWHFFIYHLHENKKNSRKTP